MQNTIDMRFASLLLLIMAVTPFACNKKEWLDKRPNDAAFVPSRLEDLQGMTDDELLFGLNSFLPYLSSDEFIIPETALGSLRSYIRNAYLWNEKIYDTTEPVLDWDNPYAQVFRANYVLEEIPKLVARSGKKNELDALMGDAYFKRAFSFFNLALVFAPPYDAQTATTDLGIPLRLTTDSKEKLYRATVQATYEQIIGDLNKAAGLLPAAVDPGHPNRASRPTVSAMLSRVYISMQDYQQAATAATECLNVYDSLIDFNQLNVTAPNPFDVKNKETLYQSKVMQGNVFISLFRGKGAIIDTELIKLYQPGDLRTSIFFMIKPNGQATIKGSLSGDIFPFSGLSTPEVFLNLAESEVRLGHTAVALRYINDLLRKRYKSNQFTPYTDTSAGNVLQFILQERRKELVLRGTRWMDVRRLNKAGANIELKRNYQGSLRVLSPNSLRYVFAIPEDVLAFHKYPQNDR